MLCPGKSYRYGLGEVLVPAFKVSVSVISNY